MTDAEFISLIGQCGDAIGWYSVSRPALLHEMLSLADMPGGPWRGTGKRPLNKGDIQLELARPAAGALGFGRNANPDAPMDDFRLIDPQGKAAQPGGKVHTIQDNICFALDRLTPVVAFLRDGLSRVETEAAQRGLMADKLEFLCVGAADDEWSITFS